MRGGRIFFFTCSVARNLSDHRQTFHPQLAGMFAAHKLPLAAECGFGQCQQDRSESARQQRPGLRRVSRCSRPCFASSVKPPAPAVGLPEPLHQQRDSREVRRQLEQLYQLDVPSTPLWYSSSLVQQVAKYGLLGTHLPVQLREPPPDSTKATTLKDPDSKRKKDDFYANVGSAIRTLREETPLLFQQDLTCKIWWMVSISCRFSVQCCLAEAMLNCMLI